jgi:hypothetical protein
LGKRTIQPALPPARPGPAVFGPGRQPDSGDRVSSNRLGSAPGVVVVNVIFDIFMSFLGNSDRKIELKSFLRIFLV